MPERAARPASLPLIDTALVDRFVPVARAIRAYLRGRVLGVENIPVGPALLVGNHNAGITFLEPVLLGLVWHERMNGEDGFYYLAHDSLMAMPGLGPLLARGGAVPASHAAAQAIFEAGRKVAVWPGGNHEAFRPWKERHRVDFGGHRGFARLALKNRVPIVPVLSLGGHEAYFVISRGERLARLTGFKKRFRSESFPIFLGLPWGLGVGPLFHLPLPVRTLVEVGAPIPLDRYAADAHEDEATVTALSALVQDTLQGMMDRQLALRRWGWR